MKTVKVVRRKSPEPYQFQVPSSMDEAVINFGNDLLLEIFNEGLVSRMVKATKSGSFNEGWKPELKSNRKINSALSHTKEMFGSMEPDERLRFLRGITEMAKEAPNEHQSQPQ